MRLQTHIVGPSGRREASCGREVKGGVGGERTTNGGSVCGADACLSCGKFLAHYNSQAGSISFSM